MKAILLILVMLSVLGSYAQQEYFVYIQSEKQQPFYVRMGDRNQSSSSTGYAIISKLRDSAYTFYLGFPQNQFGEQEFNVRIGGKDKGFELKNLGDKGWALFNFQSMELIYSVRKSTGGGASFNMVRKNDGFARLMSGVVNDTAVLYAIVMEEPKPAIAKTEQPKVTTEVAKNEPAAKETVEKIKDDKAGDAGKKLDSGTVTISAKEPVTPVNVRPEAADKGETKTISPEDSKSADSIAEAGKKEQETRNETTEIAKAPVVDIKVLRTFITDTGYYQLVMDNGKDSIDIFIPADAEVSVKKTEKETAEKSEAVKAPAKVVTDSSVKKSETLKDIDSLRHEGLKAESFNSAKTDTSRPAGSNAETAGDPQKKLVMINSDCRSFASGNDVDKLRANMIREKDIDGRLAAAKKYYKTRCFTAQQVRALSEMFPYDADKYRFFEVSYPFVSDTHNFKSLVSLLKDPVSVQKFRKLVRLD